MLESATNTQRPIQNNKPCRVVVVFLEIMVEMKRVRDVKMGMGNP